MSDQPTLFDSIQQRETSRKRKRKTATEISEARRRAVAKRWETHPWVSLCPEDRLRLMYVDQRMTVAEVAALIGCSPKHIATALRKFGISCRPAIPRDQSGSKGPGWKGANATYGALHLRVEKLRGKPSLCSACGKTEGRFEWANLTGKYDDVNDYDRLCKSCHCRLDRDRALATGQLTSKHVRRKASGD